MKVQRFSFLELFSTDTAVKVHISDVKLKFSNLIIQPSMTMDSMYMSFTNGNTDSELPDTLR